jgi:hypothetical protein
MLAVSPLPQNGGIHSTPTQGRRCASALDRPEHPLQVAAASVQEADRGAGKWAKLQQQANNGAQIAQYGREYEDAKANQEELLKLAGQTTPEEAEQARLTVILGAVSSYALIVLLKQLLDALFPPRRRKAGAP